MIIIAEIVLKNLNLFNYKNSFYIKFVNNIILFVIFVAAFSAVRYCWNL